MPPSAAQSPPPRAVPHCIASLRTPLLVAGRFRRQGDHADAQVQEIPQAHAYSVILQMQDFASHRLWLDGKLIHAGGHSRSTMALTDLTNAYSCQHLSDYDNVRLQIRHDALKEMGDELFGGKLGRLRVQQGVSDPVIRALTHALLPSLHQREAGDEIFIEHVTLAIAAHLLRKYGQVDARLGRRGESCKLTDRQLAQAKEYMAAHLAQGLTLAGIATQCSMSRATFARAFKNSTGSTPFAWIRNQRVERAKRLLGRSDLTLAGISAECGFADQSHLSRVFTQIVGVGPRTWRAMHAA